ncbi:hypothetical protein TRVL_02992 [Trypanosoma vivax]|nr:hypothetical protein TRVL_02992 [Trypanosoma vivax]
MRRCLHSRGRKQPETGWESCVFAAPLISFWRPRRSTLLWEAAPKTRRQTKRRVGLWLQTFLLHSRPEFSSFAIWKQFNCAPHMRSGVRTAYCSLLIFGTFFSSIAVAFVVFCTPSHPNIIFGVSLKVIAHLLSLSPKYAAMMEGQMQDAAAYDKELRNQQEHVNSILREMQTNSNSEQRQKLYANANDLVKKIKKTHELFRAAIQLTDSHERAMYEEKEQTHRAILSQLERRLRCGKPGDASVEGNQGSLPGPPAPQTDDRRRAQAIVRNINVIQSSTLDSLALSEKLLGEAEGITADAVAKLTEQSEQLRQVKDNVDELDSEVNRAKRELDEFVRRMLSDRIIICFSVLILIAVVALIVLKITKHKQ